jgi:glycosyltransferase A (GT-A) superfamily protein (DUF2064 family)
MDVGIACFVKTPGLSPVKTRLAKTVGQEAAEAIYLQSVAAIEETLILAKAALPQLTPYWAVAESSASEEPLWNRLPRIMQQGDGLGSRLHYIYSTLLEQHRAAIVIGSDSPQLSVRDIEGAIEALSASAAFVLGGAKDGGFYLMGGTERLPQVIWESVSYSVATTGAELRRQLAPLGLVAELPVLGDLDEVSDIDAILRDLRELKVPSAAQILLSDSLAALSRNAFHGRS